MRLVIRTREKELELNWMFMPTFMGMNIQLKRDIEKSLEKFRGRTVTDTLLDEMHEFVLRLLLEKFPLPGLEAYLRALEGIDA
jgi:hypothetical protein